MKKSDIKRIYYNGNEITSLYWGGNLIYQKTPVYNPKRFAGKFTDDSTESDWYCKLNNSKYILPVDPETKEFDFEYEGELTGLLMCFQNRPIERLYHFPDTSNVTNMSEMFFCNSDHPSVLLSVNLTSFNTSKITTMEDMFRCAYKLKELDLTSFDVSNVTNMGYMFAVAHPKTTTLSALTTIKFGIWDMVNVTKNNGMFNNAVSLTNVTGSIKNMKNSIDIHYSPLTNASAMVFINGLAEVSATRNITFKDSTYDTLSEEQIALATSKGWSVIKA